MLTQHTTAATLLARFQAVRSATMSFCSPLTPEDLMVQSCAEASPVKWHLAHTSWFFETFVLREFVAGYQPFDPDFLWLFNSYYKSLGDMPEKKLRASFSRPPLDQILAYRETVDAGIARLLRDFATQRSLVSDRRDGYLSLRPAPVGAIALYAHTRRIDIAMQPHAAEKQLVRMPEGQLRRKTPGTTEFLVDDALLTDRYDEVLQLVLDALDWRSTGPPLTLGSGRGRTQFRTSKICPICNTEINPAGNCGCG